MMSTSTTVTQRISAAVILAAGLLFMSGCMQSSQGGGVKGPEDYVYKGKADPLMDIPAEDRAETLSERFKRIQARQ